MPTNYPNGTDSTLGPDGRDDFRVTSLPEDTPLSQAGPGATRNHPQLHEDVGDAVEALQEHAAQKTHDHSGDDTDPKKGPKLKQAYTHEDPDTDSGPTAMHHTLGETGNQAAPGNHIHDYNDGSRLLNRPYVICTSTTRPPMPHKGMQIYETDTDRVRVWASFAATEAITGLNSIDNYDQGPGELSTVNWEPVSYQHPPGHGIMSTPDGQNLSWTDQGNWNSDAWTFRKNPLDAVTQTDDQVITWKTGNIAVEGLLTPDIPAVLDEATNDKYFRVSADRTAYWRVIVARWGVQVWYTTNGREEEKHLGTLGGVFGGDTEMEWRAQVVDRTFSIWRGGEFMGSIPDTQHVTNKGPDHRGWGMGMTAGIRGFGQTTPANEQWIRIQDYVYYTATNRWTVLPVGKIPVVRLRQTTSQQLRTQGTLVEWGEEMEDEFDFFNPASKTDIVVKEPGLYEIATAIQWAPSIVPDIAMVILCVNGIETGVRKQQFMRGNGFNPGFSQTLDLTGQLRFNTNDVLTVKVKYSASVGLLESIVSWFDQPSRISSRLDMHYIRV